MKKNAKKCKKICIYQKKAVPLHRHLKKTPKVNPIRNQKKQKLCTQLNKQNSKMEYLPLYNSFLLDLTRNCKPKTKRFV